MKGKNVLKHRDITEITAKLRAGILPQEVSNWLKMKYKDDHMMILSGVTLTAYRNNFLKLDKSEMAALREEVLMKRNTGDVNAIDTFTAVKEFTEAKDALTTELKADLVTIADNFTMIQSEIKDRMLAFKTQTIDGNGNPVWNIRNEEVFLGYLARLESMSVSFSKISNDMLKQQQKAGNTDIQITVHEMNKYAEAFKDILQQICVELDPGLLPRALQIYTERIGQIEGVTNPNQLNISINNSGPAQNISITTSPQQTPMVDMNSEPVKDKINIIDTKEIN
jgi:hypothetical protein